MLAPKRGSYQPEMHNDTIYNVEWIAQALKGSEFEKLLRLSPPSGKSRLKAAARREII